MNTYDTGTGTAQDDWLAGLMVAEEPKSVAPSVPQPPALPPTKIPASTPAAVAVVTPTPPPVPSQIPVPPVAAPASVPTPPPVPASAPPAPAGENWLAMVVPEAAANSMRTPIKSGVSLRQRLKLGERSLQVRALLTQAAKRMLPLLKRQFVVPFILGAATMYAGETTVRYFFPPTPAQANTAVEPKPKPPVKPDQQVVVPPKPITKPDNSTASNNTTPTPPIKPDTSTATNTPIVPLTAPNFDWILNPATTLPSNRPAINPQNPWSIPNDFQSLFNPKPNQ